MLKFTTEEYDGELLRASTLVPESVSMRIDYRPNPESETTRRKGRQFDVVNVVVDWQWIVTEGSCNHVPTIDKMINLTNPVLRAVRVAEEEFEEATRQREAARRRLFDARALLSTQCRS